LFYNPKSGGGKAERFHVAREARDRGVEPVELHLGDDLATLVLDAIANGADAVGVAGGDGTQAIAAAIAAERGLPYVCVPAETRNHFALDLDVDRDDVVGALDAFTKGGERVVDLAEVNGRVFVNNVSLGVYAEAVQSTGYRDAKLRTIAETMPTALGPGGDALDSAGRARTAATTTPARSCWSPTTPTDSAAHSAPALDPASTPASSGSPSSAQTQPGALTNASSNGPHHRSKSDLTGPSQPASTAKPSSSTRRCASAPNHKPCTYASPRSIQAPPPPQGCRKTRGTQSAPSPTSLYTVPHRARQPTGVDRAENEIDSSRSRAGLRPQLRSRPWPSPKCGSLHRVRKRFGLCDESWYRCFVGRTMEGRPACLT
jgi:Diacylglycerol kinase catalytic domain